MRNIYRTNNNPLLFLLIIVLWFNKIVSTTKLPLENDAGINFVQDDGDFQDFTKKPRFNREILSTSDTIPQQNNENLSSLNNNSAIIKYTMQQMTKAVLECYDGNEFTNTTTFVWKKDGIALTENSNTLTRDKRFYATFSTDKPNVRKGTQLNSYPNLIMFQVWTLHIRLTQRKDNGLYECEIRNDQSTITIHVQLELIEAHAEIIGENPKIIYPGLPLRLICELKDSIQEPQYIFWYHWDRVINYDLWDGATVRQGRQGSELIFPRAEPEHAGNYSCVPSNARQASVEIKYNGTSKSMELGSINGGVTCRIRDHISNMLLLVMVLQNVNVTTI